MGLNRSGMRFDLWPFGELERSMMQEPQRSEACEPCDDSIGDLGRRIPVSFDRLKRRSQPRELEACGGRVNELLGRNRADLGTDAEITDLVFGSAKPVGAVSHGRLTYD